MQTSKCLQILLIRYKYLGWWIDAYWLEMSLSTHRSVEKDLVNEFRWVWTHIITHECFVFVITLSLIERGWFVFPLSVKVQAHSHWESGDFRMKHMSRTHAASLQIPYIFNIEAKAKWWKNTVTHGKNETLRSLISFFNVWWVIVNGSSFQMTPKFCTGAHLMWFFFLNNSSG